MGHQAAKQVFDGLEGLTRAYPDTTTLRAFIECLVEPEEIVTTIVRGTDTSPAWQIWRDPDQAPAELLDWLGNHAGVQFDPAVGEQEKRDRLHHPAGFDSAKTTALIAEIQRTLTGTKTVRLLRNVTGHLWRNAIVTRTSETPDPAATLAAAMRQKAAGVLLTHVLSDGPLIDEGTRTIDATTATIDGATIADVT